MLGDRAKAREPETLKPLPAELAVAVGALLAAFGALAMRRFAETLLRRARATLAGLGGVSLLALAAVVGPGIGLDASEEPLLVTGDPAREVYARATRTFGDDDTYVIAMQTEDVFRHEHLETLRRIHERLVHLPGIRRVESLIDIHDFRWNQAEGWLEIDRFLDEVPRDPEALAALRRRALEDPVYPKLVVSRDGRSAAMNLYFRDLDDRAFVAEGLDARIRAIVAAESRPGQTFHFTGRPHLKSRAWEIMARDLARLIPVCVLVAALVVYVLGRSRRGTFLPLGACLTALLWTFGLLALTRTPLNLVTLVLAPTLIALGGLYGVHVLGRFEIEARTAASPYDAALATLRYAWLPVALAGFTTCVGFGALLWGDVYATRELGLFALFGVACLTLISLTGIPAALACLPLRERPHGPPGGRPVGRVLAFCAALAVRRPGALLLAWGVASAASLAMLPRIVIDTDYLGFFDRRSEVRRDFDAVREKLVGPVPIYVTLEGEGEGSFREPAALHALAELQARVEALPGVSTSLSMVDLVRDLNRHIEGDDPAEERIPDTRGEVSDLVFLIPKDQLRRFASSNHQAVNLLVRSGQQGSRDVRELVRRIRGELEAPELRSYATAVTGNAVVLNRSADRIAGDQLVSVGFAVVTLLALIAWIFGSLRLGLLAMVPNVVPVLVFFGLLGAGVAPLSLPTGLIGCVTLGVAIDDTVHLLVSYRRQRGDGATPEAAVRAMLEQVGRPVVVTSLMLVAGFLTIRLSGFATIRQFGELSALTMAICLATDLLLLPAVLVKARA